MQYLHPELLVFIGITMIPVVLLRRYKQIKHMDRGFIYILVGSLMLSMASLLDYADTYVSFVRDFVRNEANRYFYRSAVVIFGYFPGIVLIGRGVRRWFILTIQLEDEIERRRLAEKELKDMAVAAQAANMAKSDFLANMSHELRTPLNAIIGFSELMSSEIFGRLGANEYKEYLAMIQKSGSHLLDIVNDVLDLSNIEVGRMQLVEEEFDLSELARDCMKLMQPLVITAKLNIRTNIGIGLIVNADKRMVQQMMLNLISNAVKFTDGGGTVTIATIPMPDDGCAFMVKDTGHGMTEAEVIHVIRPFNQLEGAMTRSHEGAGLGLTLVKTFIEMHQGEMFLESLKHKGTSVCLKFPPERMIRKVSLSL